MGEEMVGLLNLLLNIGSVLLNRLRKTNKKKAQKYASSGRACGDFYLPYF
jgi:hypothetical protein